MSVADVSPSEIANFLRYAADHADFPTGIVLGIVLASLANWLANRGARSEREKRMAIDADREKELRIQLDRKEERLLALHHELRNARQDRKK